MKKDYSDIVTNYFENKLPPQEKINYEKELSSNTQLNNEHILQKHTIHGIKNSRYLELKTRLVNLTTPTITPSSSSIISSTAGKLLATIGSGAVLVVSVYFGYSYINNSELSEKKSTTKEKNLASTNIIIPIIQQEVKKSIHIEKETSTTKKENTQSNNDIRQAKKITSSQKKIVLKDSNGQEIISANEVDSPLVYQELEHPSLPFSRQEKETIDETENITSNQIFEDNIGITNDVTSKYKFHYQFVNGNLVLHGRFTTTYKVIEVNEENKNEFYLFYKNYYYRLNPSSDSPTPLEKISSENVKLIKKKLLN